MKKKFLILFLCAGFAAAAGFLYGSDYRKLHFESLVVDAHNDVVQRILSGVDISVRTKQGHSDLPRFIEGGIDVQIFSVWVPPEKKSRPYFDQAIEQIDSIESFVKRNPGRVGLAKTSKDIEILVKQGKFVVMLGMEGGHHIENDIKKLEYFYQRGVRYMGLTWDNSTTWATSAKDEEQKGTNLKQRGLTEQGRKIVQRMNELGMLVDISHVGDQTFWDLMAITSKPVIASHSSAWALCNHRRNLKDAQLDAIKKNGGVVFINFAPWFVDCDFAARERTLRKQHQARIDSFKAAVKGEALIRELYTTEFLREEYRPILPSLQSLIDHFDYVAKRIGVDHVGIGSDFDGISVTPAEMYDVTYLPNITKELLKRGYSEKDVRKILGENFMRVLKEIEKK